MEPERDYELTLLAWMAKEPSCLKNYGKNLKTRHFSSDSTRTIFQLFYHTIPKYGRAPTRVEVEQVIRNTSTRANWPLVQTEVTLKDVAEIYTRDVSPLTGEELQKYAARQNAKAMAQDLLTLDWDDLHKKIPEYKRQLDHLRDEHDSIVDLGMSVFSKEGIERGTQFVDELYKVAPVSTGWRILDTPMLGGFRPGEVSVVMAGTGVGKSLFLINMAINFVRAGKRVVYYALDNTSADMCERIYACATGMPIRRDRELNAYRQEVLEGIGHIYHDLFILLEWPPMRHRASEIKTHLARMEDQWIGKLDEVQGLRPKEKWGKADVVIVDYGDLFLPENSKGEAKRFDLADTYYELVATSRELYIPAITATQSNRAGMSSENLSLEHVSEALAKLQPVGNVLGLAQTVAEKVRRAARLQILKLRRPEGAGFYIPICIDSYRQIITPDPRCHEPWPMFEPNEEQNAANRDDSNRGTMRMRGREKEIPEQQGPPDPNTLASIGAAVGAGGRPPVSLGGGQYPMEAG